MFICDSHVKTKRTLNKVGKSSVFSRVLSKNKFTTNKNWHARWDLLAFGKFTFFTLHLHIVCIITLILHSYCIHIHSGKLLLQISQTFWFFDYCRLFKSLHFAHNHLICYYCGLPLWLLQIFQINTYFTFIVCFGWIVGVSWQARG